MRSQGPIARRGDEPAARVAAGGARPTLPFEDGCFDAAYAWQVLYYNDREGWKASVAELEERVCKRGALILVATAAPGDVSQTDSTPLEEFTYRLSSTTGQEGCIVTVPDRDALPRFFSGRDLDRRVWFQVPRHVDATLIVTYRTKTHD